MTPFLKLYILKSMYDDSEINLIKEWLGSGSINIFGRPFAGKDIQANNLIELIGGNLVGGGDILRSDNMTDEIKALMKTGKLIPTEKYQEIVLPYLNQKKFQNKPLFLSSVGRWYGEEDAVIRALEKSGHQLKAVIHLEISEQESYARWKNRDIYNDRGERHDDTVEILKIRLDECNKKTIPVIEKYQQMGILIKIDGTKKRAEVTQDIIESLGKMRRDGTSRALA